VTATTGGTYTLLVAVPEVTTADVGALGWTAFEPGWYAYTGSAFGPGGLGRVDRRPGTGRHGGSLVGLCRRVAVELPGDPVRLLDGRLAEAPVGHL